MTRCAHLMPADEAYSFDPETGESVPAIVMLCEWPDQNPGRLVDAPRWMLKLVGSGLPVRPESDCVGCPAFRAAIVTPGAPDA